MQNRQAHNASKLKTIPVLLLISTAYLFFALCLWRTMTVLLVNLWGGLGFFAALIILGCYTATNEFFKRFIKERLGDVKNVDFYLWGIILIGAAIGTGIYLLLNIEGLLKSFIK
jgi:hypothetical protein